MSQSGGRSIAAETIDSSWRSLYIVGGVAALATVLVGIAESGLQALPGGMSTGTATVVDWFTLYQSNPFMGLRNLGLLNMGFSLFAIPAYLALLAAHRKAGRVWAALATVLAFLGVAVFFGTNRALPMLDLSHQYAAATTDAQRTFLVTAGQVMLSVGQSHTPGTFPAFAFAEAAGLLMAVAMLRGKVFGRINAYLGIVGFAIMLVFEVLTSFVLPVDSTMMLAMFGGLLSSAWFILAALRLFRLEC